MQDQKAVLGLGLRKFMINIPTWPVAETGGQESPWLSPPGVEAQVLDGSVFPHTLARAQQVRNDGLVTPQSS